MITSDLASRLQLLDPLPQRVTQLAFVEGTSLWRKQKSFKDFKNKEISAKRYEYCKLGKTFGFETKRYLAQYQGRLFYFNDRKDEDYLGFCDLENIYVQWLRLREGKYLMMLFNGGEQSLFYFNQPDFWEQQKEEFVKYAIQLDFSQKYQLLQTLGVGSFSQVHLVHCLLTGQYLAAKIIPKVDKKEACTKYMAASECKILHLMQGERGVATFKQFFENNDSYIIILERIMGKDMMTVFQQERAISLSKLKKIFTEILSILRECHSRHIIHRDIKPHNILLNPLDLQPRIIDFGLALITNQEMQSHCYFKCGTIGYTAPEVLLTDSAYYKSYGYKCDIFSFGIVAHMFLMGYNPLNGKTLEETTKNSRDIVKLNEEEIRAKYGECGLIFMQRLLAPNHKQRYSAQEALNSVFLRGCSDHEGSASTIQSGNRRSHVEEGNL